MSECIRMPLVTLSNGVSVLCLWRKPDLNLKMFKKSVANELGLSPTIMALSNVSTRDDSNSGGGGGGN